MTELLDFAPAQRGPVQRFRATGSATSAGAEQSNLFAIWPFEGGAEQSNLFAIWPFEGGAGQSWAGPGTDWFPFE